MALNKQDGAHQANDIVQRRLKAGTVGNDMIQGQSISARKITSIIDDSDPAIVYAIYNPSAGTGAGSLNLMGTTDFVAGGTQTIIGGLNGNGGPGTAALLKFKGSSIAVLGGTNPNSGNMRVYIDGVETAGRVPIFTGLRVGSVVPAVTATDTTIYTLAPTNFPASGTLYLGGELIDYTSCDANGFYGLTRGARGTTATSHNANETVYLWASSIGLYSSTYSAKQILYYNPLLSDGDHTILIVTETNSTSGYARIFFDGFITGPLLGANNILTQTVSIAINGVVTDANGHADLGGLVVRNNDVARIATVGYSQTNCESGGATTMGKLGLKYNIDGTITYYIHNGPASASINIVLTLAMLGESL